MPDERPTRSYEGMGGSPRTSPPSPTRPPESTQSPGGATPTANWEARGTNVIPGRMTMRQINTPSTTTGDTPAARNAYGLKVAHPALTAFSDDDLQRIPVLPTGTHLDQGETYFDLHHPEGGEITAYGDTTAQEDNAFVPKRTVESQLWDRLLRVHHAAPHYETRRS